MFDFINFIVVNCQFFGEICQRTTVMTNIAKRLDVCKAASITHSGGSREICRGLNILQFYEQEIRKYGQGRV